MYVINNTIKNQPFDQLQVQKLVKTEVLQILTISLEKDAVFHEHTSPLDVELIMLEGEIVFHIEGQSFQLTTLQHFSFPKETKHWVKANEDSKFLIIR